ncbi:MAG: DUF2062 domain-containing protein [Burkholderiaceae bacterium]
MVKVIHSRRRGVHRRSGTSRVKRMIRRSIPDRHTLAAHPWLKPVAEHLLHPRLWHLQHEAVARGVAIGLFWAFAIPVGQILAAAAHCIWWRANVPIAVGMTLITNPFTTGFWLWLAFEMGSKAMGRDGSAPPLGDMGLVQWVMALGQPALLGLGLLASGSAVLGYIAVKLGWRLRVHFDRRQGMERRRVRREKRRVRQPIRSAAR